MNIIDDIHNILKSLATTTFAISIAMTLTQFSDSLFILISIFTVYLYLPNSQWNIVKIIF